MAEFRKNDAMQRKEPKKNQGYTGDKNWSNEKRFLDDIFAIYTGSIESLHKMHNELNKLHPTIKFTMSHTIPYLKENLIVV